jgi:hypothetical protein
MKIDKILFVSDENPNYLGFWPSISKFYKTVYNINPHLFFIGNKNDENKKYLTDEHGQITTINPIVDIPIIIQSLWAKFWFTQTEPETVWLIGDIDLYLLNKTYLDSCLVQVPDNESYLHINANGYKMGNWWENPLAGLPGYFHCAKGKVFKEYLKLSDDFIDDCKYIYNSKKYGILYNGMIQKEEHAPERVKDKTDYGFICCEENLSTERLIPHKDKIYQFTYPANLTRLETHFALSSGRSTPCDFDLLQIYNESVNYIDFHCPRPYACFANQIEHIIYNSIK